MDSGKHALIKRGQEVQNISNEQHKIEVQYIQSNRHFTKTNQRIKQFDKD